MEVYRVLGCKRASNWFKIAYLCAFIGKKKNYGMCSFSVWPQFFRVHAMVSDPPHLSPLQVGFPEEGHPNEHQTRPQVVHYTVAFLNDVLQLMIVHAH